MSRPGYPAAHPPPEEIIACMPVLRRALRHAAWQDVDDVIQATLIGAVVAVREGRYRPDPAQRPDVALRRWLVRIALNQLGHVVNRAHRRREVLMDHPDLTRFAEALGLVPDVEHAVLVVESLRAVAQLPRDLRDVAVLAGLGWRISEIAVHLGISYQQAWRLVRQARRLLNSMREG